MMTLSKGFANNRSFPMGCFVMIIKHKIRERVLLFAEEDANGCERFGAVQYHS
jgi:hypothetical protein